MTKMKLCCGDWTMEYTFSGIPYDGSVVNMGVKDENGEICYIISVLKSIRKRLGKKDGDAIHMTISERSN